MKLTVLLDELNDIYKELGECEVNLEYGIISHIEVEEAVPYPDVTIVEEDVG